MTLDEWLALYWGQNVAPYRKDDGYTMGMSAVIKDLRKEFAPEELRKVKRG